MAISLTYKDISEKFNSRHWSSMDDFEEYYLKRLRETRADTIYYTNIEDEEVVLKPINHFPELKEYEVWEEGYAATGESSGAGLIGKAMARNFAQACHIVMCKSHLEWIEKINDPSHEGYVDAGRWDYDPHQLSHWACDLYWSEELARKSFG